MFSQLSLCGKDSLKWANVAIKVSLEAHNLLHDAWPDETVGQVSMSWWWAGRFCCDRRPLYLFGLGFVKPVYGVCIL